MKAFAGRARRSTRESYREVSEEGEALDGSIDLLRKIEAVPGRDQFEDEAEEIQAREVGA